MLYYCLGILFGQWLRLSVGGSHFEEIDHARWMDAGCIGRIKTLLK